MVRKKITIALFNDTGSYPHIGCKAVSNAHNNQLHDLNVLVLFRHFVGEFVYLQAGNYLNSLQRFFVSELVRETSVVDAVIVNGEGTIHHGYGLHLLSILAGAQILGKPTYLINAVLQEIPNVYFDVLRKLNDLTVRDQCSYEYLKSQNIRCRLVPDSILNADFYLGKDYSFEGKVVVTDCVANRSDVQEQLSLVIEYYGVDAIYYPLEGNNSYSWQSALKKFSGAKLIVTGRHHGLYLALMAKTPFVAMSSNTWKVEGTLRAIGAIEWLWDKDSDEDLISMCEKALLSKDKFSPIYESEFLKNSNLVFKVFANDFSLNEERGLHMDMTRDTGERSDAHIVRYQWACNYIKNGDRVLDAACGLGYGGHVVRHLTHAAKVVGIDGSEYGIDYATKAFPCTEDKAEYRVGILPDILSDYPDGSFDVIISFETLEHVEEPVKLLQEFHRLLTPGGRIIVSVPNDWSDESGEDPNPYHFHVYDWNRLTSELSANFILEDAYAQTASQCKIAAKGGEWERHPRLLKQVALTAHPIEDCEWWLMTAMKSPLEDKQPYEERVFANITASEHPSIRYTEYFDNPWLIYAMVNISYRLKNVLALEVLANQVMATMPVSSNDYVAALCVKAYSVHECIIKNPAEVDVLITQIEQVTRLPCKDIMGVRWKVSLLFIKGKLLQATGQFEMALEAFVECSKIDVRDFGIHLATKITEAFYLAGKLAYTMRDREQAHLHWRNGIEYGKILLSVSLDDVLINPEFPNRFNHGDGVREYTVAWDNIAKCANGVHLLKLGGNLDFSALDACLLTEYSNVTTSLIDTRQTLAERTTLFEQSSKELAERTDELVDNRKVVEDCTNELIDNRKELAARTKLYEQASKDLAERTVLYEQTSKDLAERTDELVDNRKELAMRTELYEQASKDLAERTVLYEQTSKELAERTDELVDNRKELATRTELYEQASKDLAERTVLYEQTSKDLAERTDELVDNRKELAMRTELYEQASIDLVDRTDDLIFNRYIIVERTEMLEQLTNSLKECTEELEEIKIAYSEIKKTPLRFAIKSTVTSFIKKDV